MAGAPAGGRGTSPPARPAYAVQDASAELVTVRLPDGRLVQGERADAARR